MRRDRESAGRELKTKLSDGEEDEDRIRDRCGAVPVCLGMLDDAVAGPGGVHLSALPLH